MLQVINIVITFVSMIGKLINKSELARQISVGKERIIRFENGSIKALSKEKVQEMIRQIRKNADESISKLQNYCND